MSRRRALLRQGAAFSPLDLSPVLWLDASDASTITESGGAVSQWDDKSGNDNHMLQANASFRPSLSESIGSLSAIAFDGVNDEMTGSSVAFGASIVDASALFAIKTLSVTTTGTLISLTGSSSPNRWQTHFPWSNGIAYFDVGTSSGSDRISSASGLSANDELICSFTAESTTGLQEIRINGSQLIADNSATTVTPALPVAIGGFGGDYQYVAVGECVVIDGTITVSDRQKLEGYLAWKWGLEGNLPSGHPYELAAP